ncbi:MAG: protein-disulfide reductase DsbD N-terminal domain-containing protein [Mariniblastus sp.]|nr:protein-disulfide reductase DsbD N-terminal domain-containing protein [Mariniblastus sp.]
MAARYHVESGTNRGYLIVKAEMPVGSYIYGIYQSEESPCSKIEIGQSKQFKVLGKFKADKKAKVVAKDPVFESRLEKYYDVVQFYVPIELTDQVDPAKIKPVVRFTGQICSDEGYCIPIQGKTMAVKFMGFFQRQANESSLRQKKIRK